MQLNEIELRALGVLIEKALTQPGSYPLTLNAIQLGANQKQNRDPVVDYSESDISRAVHSLQLRNLIKQAPPSPGARANRFAHNVVEVLHWDRREQAIMAELIMRGRQTAGELRTHASRMTPFPDIEGVTATLRGLSQGEHRFVEELAREPGRSANRFRHLMSAGGAVTADAAAPREVNAPASKIPPSHSHADDFAALEARVSRLELRLEQLLQGSGQGPADDPPAGPDSPTSSETPTDSDRRVDL